MKHIKNNIKLIKMALKVGAIALLLLCTIACEKESNTNETSFQPFTDQGNNLKLTYPDGTTENINGDGVRGWGSGRLLGDSYYKQLGIGNGERVLSIRINIPKGIKKDSIIGVELKLDGSRLYLQNSANIPIRPELWVDGTGFDVYENAVGTIKIIETDSYDIIGEIKAQVIDNTGKTVKISGFFWKKNAESYSG